MEHKNKTNYVTSKITSLYAAREASDKGSHSEVILEDDVDMVVEHGSSMGTFSRTPDNEPSDEAIQNEECKYYEVDQVVFEEKLVSRDTELGRR